MVEVNSVMEQLVGNLVEEGFLDEEHQSGPVDVALSKSTVSIADVPALFRNLVSQEHLPHGFWLHLSIFDDEMRYEQMGSHYVLFYGLDVVGSIPFQSVIGTSKGEYRGLKTKGLEELLRMVSRAAEISSGGDLGALKAILGHIEQIEKHWGNLSGEATKFLEQEFTEESFLYVRRLKQNIEETITDLPIRIEISEMADSYRKTLATSPIGTSPIR